MGGWNYRPSVSSRAADGPARYVPSTKEPILTNLRFLLSLMAFAWVPSALAIPTEEVVPKGAWFMKMTETHVTETKAISRLRREGPLKNYVVPSESQPEATSGDIQRTRAQTEARMTYGLSNKWNLALRLPYNQVQQSSSLVNDSADEATQARLDTLGNEDLAGLGNIRLALLYRPVFSDRNGFVWTFGLSMPGSSPQVPYQDSTTLAIAEPVDRYLVAIQYTRFPTYQRSRFDLAVEVSTAIAETVEVAGGGQADLSPGKRVMGKLGWLQELGAVSYGVETEYLIQDPNRVDGQNRNDNILRWVHRLHLGFGNLAALESSDGGWPYRVLLGWETIYKGFNTPSDDVMSVSLETFF